MDTWHTFKEGKAIQVNNQDGERIAMVHPCDCGCNRHVTEARLISKAPELLLLLQFCVDTMMGECVEEKFDSYKNQVAAAVERSRFLIAQIKGE